VVSEPANGRREKSLQIGADLALDPRNTDVVQVIHKRTGGRGVDVAFECAGSEPGLLTAVNAVKARGMVMNIALWEKQPTLNMNLLVLKEKTITASSCYVGVHKDVISALSSGKLNGIEELITRKLPLRDVVTKGFEALVNEKDTQSQS
jgi:threonine dehydrogenase-like Zn-dependent dehydrogenase